MAILPMTQPAIGFGDGQAEDAQFGHLVNDLQRDQLVAHMPAMGMGGDLLVGKAMKLVGDHAVGFVQIRDRRNHRTRSRRVSAMA